MIETNVLREKVLDLAIRGKLVPQDPNDEPASVLLERIRTEKQQMVKDGKLKAKDIKNDTIIFKGEDNLHYEKFQDGTVKCIEDEIPFEVPEGWAWSRLRNITQFLGGYAYKSSKYIRESNNIVIRMGNIKNNELHPHITKTCISDEYAVETSSYVICQNDILFTMTGTRGKRDYFYSCLVNAEDLHDANLYLNQRVGCLRIFDINRIYPSYLVTVLQSRSVLDAIFKTETGNVSQGNIGSMATLNLLIPIPPTREQFDIHMTVQSILELIGTYEIEKKNLHSIIRILKTKILDLAIRGKLVPQDPNDEPASVLLERIYAEKEELIKQGKIKRDKKESIIFRGDDNSYYEKIGNDIICIDEELPFDIPHNWRWCRLGNIGDWAAGSTPSRSHPEYYNGTIPWLKTGDLNDGYITNIPESISEEALKNTSVRLNPSDSVLIAMYGATIGKLGILTFPATTNQACCACSPLNGINNRYLFYYLLSQKDNFVYRGVGGAQSNISKEKIVTTLMPVPPYEQQCKILDKIDDFFDLISDIEKSLN